jgi:hypothetical protein
MGHDVILSRTGGPAAVSTLEAHLENLREDGAIRPA